MARNLNGCWAKLDNAYYIALLKDTILDRLIEKDNSNPYPLFKGDISLKTDDLAFSVGDIFTGTSPAILKINVLAKEIAKQDRVSIEDTPEQNGGKVYLLTITEGGIYFRNVEGGYVSLYWKSVWQKTWLFAKTLAAVLNACAIIYLTYLQVKKDSPKADKLTTTPKVAIAKQKADSVSIIKPKVQRK